jgi:hypothetical protein
MQEISGVAEGLLAFQEILCSMEVVMKLRGADKNKKNMLK